MATGICSSFQSASVSGRSGSWQTRSGTARYRPPGRALVGEQQVAGAAGAGQRPLLGVHQVPVPVGEHLAAHFALLGPSGTPRPGRWPLPRLGPGACRAGSGRQEPGMRPAPGRFAKRRRPACRARVQSSPRPLEPAGRRPDLQQRQFGGRLDHLDADARPPRAAPPPPPARWPSWIAPGVDWRPCRAALQAQVDDARLVEARDTRLARVRTELGQDLRRSRAGCGRWSSSGCRSCTSSRLSTSGSATSLVSSRGPASPSCAEDLRRSRPAPAPYSSTRQPTSSSAVAATCGPACDLSSASSSSTRSPAACASMARGHQPSLRRL